MLLQGLAGDKLLQAEQTVYRKIPKNSDTRKIAVIILEFEQCGSAIEARARMSPKDADGMAV